ncbi:DUF1232 domain-containing protein [Aggregicoccus sp. 17bor-14]|uniref:YkvA family protein n=1 Tax=Myxococcaceae TaxID=31 RepID=UPI00129D071A|nr:MULTISPECIES: YkvA family protein [Myxococcaceae]MBF5043188.1 DUF1232 domain-containing protein [Simulacricoccus sp. 17bor-14]MRI88946.1 DUF1232 domain-containing protein [Aggregicoccus sp. 17bor-14]
MNVTGPRGFGSKLFSYVRDPHVALWRKLVGVLALLYLLSPVDAVPDFIPVLGWLDDLGVLSAAALFIAREVSRYVPGPRSTQQKQGAVEDAEFEDVPRPVGSRRRVV